MTGTEEIPFNFPYLTGVELENITIAHRRGQLSGDGYFTKLCHAWFESRIGSRTLLTHSCTAALEMSAFLIGLQPGDEVIMPSYTFVSTANAFVLRGAVPVFVDIQADTLNLDETLIESAITGRTKAIVVVHYAGVGCEMDTILEIARRYGLVVVEDAAQGVMATYKGKYLGTFGSLGTYSFHETKNITSGEGGALVISDPSLFEAAEICREKGTDRSRLFRGQVDKYTWQAMGSSYLPGELVAAFLYAQLLSSDEITVRRLQVWAHYHAGLADQERSGILRRPVVPAHCAHNGHMYYVLLPPDINRQQIITKIRRQGISTTFHYVPLHSSPAGVRYSKVNGPLPVTDRVAGSILRLPMWVGLSTGQQDRVIETLTNALKME